MHRGIDLTWFIPRSRERIAPQCGIGDRNSVRPSVRQTRELWQNESTKRKNSIMTNRKPTKREELSNEHKMNSVRCL